MPSQRSISSTIYFTYIVALILSLGKIIPSYTRYIKKGLVYIAILTLLSTQPSSYAKYTKLNMQLSCNI